MFSYIFKFFVQNINPFLQSKRDKYISMIFFFLINDTNLLMLLGNWKNEPESFLQIKHFFLYIFIFSFLLFFLIIIIEIAAFKNGRIAINFCFPVLDWILSFFLFSIQKKWLYFYTEYFFLHCCNRIRILILLLNTF